MTQIMRSLIFLSLVYWSGLEWGGGGSQNVKLKSRPLIFYNGDFAADKRYCSGIRAL